MHVDAEVEPFWPNHVVSHFLREANDSNLVSEAKIVDFVLL